MGREAADGIRRSQGQMVVARALWYVKPGVAELRTERLSMARSRRGPHQDAVLGA